MYMSILIPCPPFCSNSVRGGGEAAAQRARLAHYQAEGFVLWLQTASAATRYIFILWIALLITFIVGFGFILSVDLSEWEPAATGNHKAAPAHCDPATARLAQHPAGGGCDCWSFEPESFDRRWVDAAAFGTGHKLGDDDFATLALPFESAY